MGRVVEIGWWEQGRGSMYCALTFFGSLSDCGSSFFKNRPLIPKFLKDFSLHHLVLIGSDEPGQTAGQQHANQLGECDSKCHSSNDPHVSLHKTGHQIITALLVNFGGSHSQIVQIQRITISFVHAATGGDTMFQEVGAAAPVGVVLHATAAQAALHMVHCPAPFIFAIVVLHGIRVSPQEGVLDLMTKHKSRNASNQLSQEHQGQEHGIQFQHPWATTARSKASKEAKDHNGGAGSNEHVGSICGVLRNKGDVGSQSQLSPDSNSQQDRPCDPEDEGVDDEEGFETGYHRFGLHSPR